METKEFNQVFADAADSSTVRTVHRLRANSTIMQVNKVLGLLSFFSFYIPHAFTRCCSGIVWMLTW